MITVFILICYFIEKKEQIYFIIKKNKVGSAYTYKSGRGTFVLYVDWRQTDIQSLS